MTAHAAARIPVEDPPHRTSTFLTGTELVLAASSVMGLALLIAPSLVGQLLLGEQLSGVATPVARVAGIALIALGSPVGQDGRHSRAC